MRDHDAEEVIWDNVRQQRALVCSCGFVAYGDTWEEAGAELDNHIEEEEKPQ